MPPALDVRLPRGRRLDLVEALDDALRQGLVRGDDDKHASVVEAHDAVVVVVVAAAAVLGGLRLGLLRPRSAVVVGEQRFTEVDCFIQAVSANRRDGEAWFRIADISSATDKHLVRNRPFTKVACLVESLSTQPGNFRAWHQLAELATARGTVTVGGRAYTRRQLLVKVLELNFSCRRAWADVAADMADVEDSILVGTNTYNKEACARLSAME